MLIFGAINIDEKFLAEIGRMVVVNSLIEHELKHLIETMVSNKFYGNSMEIVTSELSGRDLINITKSLLTDREMFEKHKELIKKITEVTDKRNTIIHSLYGVRTNIETNNRTIVRLKNANRKGKLNKQKEEITEKELKELTDEMMNCYVGLIKLCKRCALNEEKIQTFYD